MGYSGMGECDAKLPTLAGSIRGLEQQEPWYLKHNSISGFFYRWFLLKQKEFLVYGTKSMILENIVGCISAPKFKKEIYNILRTKAMTNIGGRSVVINEITGIYSFVKGVAKYAKITAKMYLGK